MEADNRITGKTKLMGVIGNPIEHSISPQLHNTLNKMLGLDFVYVPFRVETGALQDAVKGLKALGLVGFNVTVPYKNDVLEFLDETTEEVKIVGAANTIKNAGGRLYGYNTDTEGFARSFKEDSGTGFEGKKVAVLGAGGAARAIAVKVASEGAAGISIINRTVSKAMEIAGIINSNIGTGTDCYRPEDSGAAEALFESDIVINTTSIGMFPRIDECPVDKNTVFREEQIVYDIIYNPVKTKLLKKAEESGCKVINGLGMLFYQGIYAYEIWTGLKISEEKLREAYACFVKILGK